ncbi:MAG: TetR/AcrR family transcriptional regulator [Proteobacteria bacterium]|nr:TetR/AcrR family transcriptional regulator [Pseudomonadota bacterium]
MAQRLSTDTRRAELLDVGLRVFGDQPYEAVKLDAIAASAGISKGLLYHYFKGKRAFYLATLREVSERMLVATEVDPALPIDQAIAKTLRAFLTYIRDNSRLYLALLRGGAGVDPDAVLLVEEVRNTELRRIASALGHPKPSPQLELALYGFIGLAEAVGARFITEGHDEDAVLSLLIDSLGAIVAREVAHA